MVALGRTVSSLFALAALGSCVSCLLLLDAAPASAEDLRYFGFVGIDCGVEDPHDDEPIVDYLPEVTGFTNLAHLCVYDPSTASSLPSRLARMNESGIKAILDVQNIFFEPGLVTAPAGTPALQLRPDALQRWQSLVAGSGLQGLAASIGAVTVVDEPTWNGVRAEDLAQAVRWVKGSLAGTTVLVVEAWPVIDQLEIPEDVDWLAFDRYGVADPANDPDYLADLETLRSRRSRPDQKLLLILETQWLPVYGDLGFPPEAMGQVAVSTFELAQRESDVIGLVGYLWPGGLDEPGQLGARNLPPLVQDLYREMGRAILGSDPDCATTTRLCLGEGNRFIAEVTWRDFEGQEGVGRSLAYQTSDSGIFYFFAESNWELMVKVLDACSFNGRFWVFSAATTNVEYTLKVTDTQTGDVTSYFNPLGTAASAVTDTDAFATCP